jgi:predicted oxidoreductase
VTFWLVLSSQNAGKPPDLEQIRALARAARLAPRAEQLAKERAPERLVQEKAGPLSVDERHRLSRGVLGGISAP